MWITQNKYYVCKECGRQVEKRGMLCTICNPKFFCMECAIEPVHGKGLMCRKCANFLELNEEYDEGVQRNEQADLFLVQAKVYWTLQV